MRRMDITKVLARLHASLEHDPRVNHHLDDIKAQYDGDTLVLSGEVSSIAAKRLALGAVAAIGEVTGIIDRLHVQPSAEMGDGAIADHLKRALMGDSAFGFCEIHRALDRPGDGMRERPSRPGQPYVEFSVQNGVVTLDGEVPSLTHKRLAGVLAWWVPGSRDVINGLGVEPPEQDTDGEILDALRVVLEKDPLVNATRIGARCERARIMLNGVVRSAAEKALVETDAWALFAIDDVVNDIEVLHP